MFKEIFKLDHTKESVPESLAISLRRAEEIIKNVVRMSRDNGSVSRSIEELLNSESYSVPEKVFALYVLGKNEAMLSSMFDTLKDSIGGITAIKVPSSINPKDFMDIMESSSSASEFKEKLDELISKGSK